MNGIKTRERTRLVERQAKSRLAQLVVAEPKRPVGKTLSCNAVRVVRVVRVAFGSSGAWIA